MTHLTRTSSLLCCRKNMQRNKQVAMGRKKFNMDPKKVSVVLYLISVVEGRVCASPWGSDHVALSSQGIQFLIENDLLKNTSDDIAQFLYKGEGLNKTAIGDYLGERCVHVCLAARVCVNSLFFFTSAFRRHFPDPIVSVVTHFLQVSHTLDPNIVQRAF